MFDTLESKRAAAVLVYHLWSSQCIGNAPPVVTARFKRMESPVVGDVVVEITTLPSLLRRDPDLLDDRWDGQFVVLLDHRTETRTYEESGETYREEVWECQGPDGPFRWTNAHIIMVPTTLDAFNEEITRV